MLKEALFVAVMLVAGYLAGLRFSPYAALHASRAARAQYEALVCGLLLLLCMAECM
jgi:hypothetical protein